MPLGSPHLFHVPGNGFGIRVALNPFPNSPRVLARVLVKTV